MLPSTGISSTLVGNELGISSHAWSTLCTSDKINMWSRYKPVRWTGSTEGTEWWKAYDSNYGITWPATSLEMLDKSFIVYDKPTGNQYPYRIGDFRGYNHQAKHPIDAIYPVELNNNVGLQLIVLKVNADSVNQLVLSDIFDLNSSEYFLGVRLSSGSVVRYKTASVAFNSGVIGNKDTIVIDIKNDPTLADIKRNSAATFYPFITTSPLTSWGLFAAIGLYYTAGLDKKTINIKDATPIKKVTATGAGFMPNAAMARCTINVKNVWDRAFHFPWNLILADISDTLGNNREDLFTEFTLNNVPITSQLVQPGETITAQVNITGATSLVDSYRITINLRWHDPDFGYTPLCSFVAKYPTVFP